jgi:hypothetical protein
MASLLPHIIRRLTEHAYKFAGLPELTVPSAAVDDRQTEAWTDEMYAHDLEVAPEARTGEL